MHGASPQQGLVRLPQQDLRHQSKDDDCWNNLRRSPKERVSGTEIYHLEESWKTTKCYLLQIYRNESDCNGKQNITKPIPIKQWTIAVFLV